MERTLEIMETELESITKQLTPLQKRASELSREIEQYRLDNALYHPMSELINYKGKTISSITLVRKEKDEKLTIEYMYNDDIFEVTDDGYLHYSSYEGGVMDYSAKARGYVRYYYGHGTAYNYVGFLEIELEAED